MWRRVLAGVLIAVVSSLGTLSAVRAAAGEDCACIKAKCCCAPKKSAAGAGGCHGDHGPAADTHQAGIRCHHSTNTLALVSTIGALPAPVSFTVTVRRTSAWERPVAAPQEGFSRLHSPPPRLES